MKKILLTFVSLLVLVILILVVNYLVFVKMATRISVGEPINPKETKNLAVLVIDIQEATTGNYSMYDNLVLNAEGLINNTNQIADSSIKYGVPVIYIRNEISNPLINILNSSYAIGSPGSQLDARLNVVSDYIVTKKKGDSFSNPMLDNILIKHDINKLVFTGLDIAHCVNSTIQAAVNRNYDICLISDALLSESDSLKQVKIDEFRQSGFEIISTAEYIENLKK